MKKATLIGAVMTFILVFTFTIVGSSYADTLAEDESSQPTVEERQEKGAEMKEKMAEVMEAVSSGDYETWVSLISDTPHGETMLSVINESNWGQFVEAHLLMQEGRAKMQEAAGIMEGLGIEKPKHKRAH